MRHTPGPWYTTTKETDRQGLICSETAGVNIAVSYDPRDAALIAAAPELLETLIKVLPHIETAKTDDAYKPGAVAKIERQIQAAIAQATAATSPTP